MAAGTQVNAVITEAVYGLLLNFWNIMYRIGEKEPVDKPLMAHWGERERDPACRVRPSHTPVACSVETPMSVWVPLLLLAFLFDISSSPPPPCLLATHYENVIHLASFFQSHLVQHSNHQGNNHDCLRWTSHANICTRDKLIKRPTFKSNWTNLSKVSVSKVKQNHAIYKQTQSWN